MFRDIVFYLLALLIPIYFLMVVIGNYTRGRGISNLSNKSNLPSINVVGYSLASAYPSYAPKGFGGDSMQALPDIKLNPWFVTGFADAESSFTMSVFKSKTAAIGWTIEPCFIITLHIKDIELLNKIQLFFGVGSVSTTGNKFARYRVRSRQDLKVIIAHFEKYPLQTSKFINFMSFCKILEHMNNKLHATVPGFLKLLSLINRLNNPLSESLLENLAPLGKIPNVDLELSSVESLNIKDKLDPWWISGFATGESSFTFFTRKRVNAAGNIVKDYTLIFEIGQKSENFYLLNLIVSSMGFGKVYTEKRGISKFRLVPRDQIFKDLVPFFEKYPLEGNKALQYSVWIKIVDALYKNPRSAHRENKVETLIKELSSLNK
jgi:hypothetical protein